MQSCLENGEVKPFVQEYGMVIVDECHHVSSVTFENVLKNITSHFVYGLTATPIRKDGLQPIIFMQCGPIRYSSDAKAQIEKQSFRRYLVPRFTSYRPITDDKQSFTALSQSLSESEIRNTLIVEDVLHNVAESRTPIILTNRTSHVKLLAEMLEPHIANVIQLTGEGSTRNKREAFQRLYDIPQDAPLVIVATGKYIGEGFDYPRLERYFLLFLYHGKGWLPNMLVAYIGREKVKQMCVSMIMLIYTNLFVKTCTENGSRDMLLLVIVYCPKTTLPYLTISIVYNHLHMKDRFSMEAHSVSHLQKH